MNIFKLCNLFYGLTKLGEIPKIKDNPEILERIIKKHNIKGKLAGMRRIFCSLF